MTEILVASNVIMALATLGIFIFTWLNYAMYQKLMAVNDEQQKRFTDLLEAVVIATLLSGPSSIGEYGIAKRMFADEYKGQTKIFKK